ncbi:MAG: hypothetical protein Q7S18_00305 [bacterium]|nr:hypothetical protein [bacterium]
MGIKVEFNPDLALRNISEYKFGKRKKEECVPKLLTKGKVFGFLKKGQRNYWLSDDEFWGSGQIPLAITSGNEKLSRPIASVKILEATHFLNNGEVWTRGKYKIIEVFKDDKIHFEGFKKICKK